MSLVSSTPSAVITFGLFWSAENRFQTTVRQLALGWPPRSFKAARSHSFRANATAARSGMRLPSPAWFSPDKAPEPKSGNEGFASAAEDLGAVWALSRVRWAFPPLDTPSGRRDSMPTLSSAWSAQPPLKEHLDARLGTKELAQLSLAAARFCVPRRGAGADFELKKAKSKQTERHL